MTPESRRKLRELAGKATRGPWIWRDDAMYATDALAAEDAGKANATYDDPAIPLIQTDSGIYGPRQNDRAYIAAAHPGAIIELLDRLDNVESALAEFTHEPIVRP